MNFVNTSLKWVQNSKKKISLKRKKAGSITPYFETSSCGTGITAIVEACVLLYLLISSGRGGEVQLTDAIDTMNKTQRVFAHVFNGERHDVGNKEGYLETSIEYGV